MINILKFLCQDDGRLPLTSVPWPVWQTTDQRLAEADKLIEDLEKKTGPLSDNVLQAGLVNNESVYSIYIYIFYVFLF